MRGDEHTTPDSDAPLLRFFARTMRDAVYGEADALSLRRAGGTLEVALEGAGRRIRSFEIGTEWFDPIRTLIESRCAAGPWPLGEPSNPPDAPSTVVGSALRFGDRVVQFRALLAPDEIVCSRFRLVAVRELARALGFSEGQHLQWQRTLVSQRRPVLLIAPSEQVARRFAGVLSVLYGAEWCGGRESPCAVEDRAEVRWTHGSDLVSLDTASRRVVSEANVLGVVAFARRVCPECSVPYRLPEQTEAALALAAPKGKGETSFITRRSDAACSSCGSGSFAPLHHVLPLTGELRASFAAPTPDSERLAARLAALGVTPLVAEAFTRAVTGEIDAAELERFVAETPGAWIKARAVLEAPLDRPAQPAIPVPAERGPSLLIVEDDQDQRNIMELVFKNAGYEVALAVDGERALEYLRSTIPDLIMLDLMMPKIGGAELVRRLRADPRFARVPILVLTVVTDREREFELLSLGADDYCDKTVQRRILMKRVENLVRRSRSVSRE